MFKSNCQFPVHKVGTIQNQEYEVPFCTNRGVGRLGHSGQEVFSSSRRIVIKHILFKWSQKCGLHYRITGTCTLQYCTVVPVHTVLYGSFDKLLLHRYCFLHMTQWKLVLCNTGSCKTKKSHISLCSCYHARHRRPRQCPRNE